MLAISDRIDDADAYLALEAMASKPYMDFVYEDEAQAERVARALYAAGAGEYAAPHARVALAPDAHVCGMITAPLTHKELGQARFRAARVLKPLVEDAEGALRRSALARQTLLAPGADDAYLSRIAVAPEARGHGAGAELVTWFLERARERGARRAVLEVSPVSEAAVRLYERLGFATLAEHRVVDEPTGRALCYRHLALEL